MNKSQFAAHHFNSLEDTDFSPEEYSRLKFGCDASAKKFGYELADKLFQQHSADLITKRAVVIPSPYNHVKNAATILTGHFLNRLNHHIVCANGEHLDYSVIHRKVSYIKDYGYLPADQRKKLIDNDDFFFNPDFYRGKTLIFVDDVFITGTHENKLVELLEKHRINNPCIFAYYGKYHGGKADIEAEINFASIRSLQNFADLCSETKHHMIVRPIKYVLSASPDDVRSFIARLSVQQLQELYFGCLGEGYYKIPIYQENFHIIADAHKLAV